MPGDRMRQAAFACVFHVTSHSAISTIKRIALMCKVDCELRRTVLFLRRASNPSPWLQRRRPGTQTEGSEKALRLCLKGEIIDCVPLLASGKGYPNYN